MAKVVENCGSWRTSARGPLLCLPRVTPPAMVSELNNAMQPSTPRGNSAMVCGSRCSTYYDDDIRLVDLSTPGLVVFRLYDVIDKEQYHNNKHY